jgi:hypothetical protein
LDSILAIGLGSGYTSSPEIGGEAGFRGSVDGVWLYQNDLGEQVLGALLED